MEDVRAGKQLISGCNSWQLSLPRLALLLRFGDGCTPPAMDVEDGGGHWEGFVTTKFDR